MSDTPRTDVEEAKKLGGWSFARTLERELAAVTRERDDAYANVEDADRELKALRSEVERLRGALLAAQGLIVVPRMPNAEHVADAHNDAVRTLRDALRETLQEPTL